MEGPTMHKRMTELIKGALIGGGGGEGGGKILFKLTVFPSSAIMSMACRGLTQCTVGRSSVKAMV